jgi:hypothetical protein
MRRNSGLWVIWIASLLCSSCETGTQQKVSVPSTPAPAAKPAPVVMTQTVAELPDPQPVPPDSVPPRPPVEYQAPVKEADAVAEPAPDPKVAKAPARTNRPVAKRPAADAPAQEAAPPAAAPGAAPGATPGATPGTTVPVVEEPAGPPKLSAADESVVSKEQVSAMIADVQKMLKDIAKRPQSSTNQAAVKRIRSFVRLAQQAMERDDIRQGDIVAHRALALARDLTAPK